MTFSKLKSLVLMIIISFTMAGNAHAEVTQEILDFINGKITPGLINETGKPNTGEEIDPVTGSLTIRQTDIQLPGRDGFDLVIGRIYNSSQAEYGIKRARYVQTLIGYEPVTLYTWTIKRYDSLTKYPNNPIYTISGGTSIILDDVIESLENEMDSRCQPEDYKCDGSISSSVVYQERYDHSYENYIEANTYLDSRYNLGKGWSFAFPSIQLQDGYKYYHNGNGASYEIDFSKSPTNLVDYQSKDAQLLQDNASFTNSQVSSKYVFIGNDGKKEYFAEDGRLIGMADRFGNVITFTHVARNINGHTNHYISKIVDSVGREITLTYEGEFASSNEEYINLKVTHPSTADTYKVRYTKTKDIIDTRNEPKLSRVQLAVDTTDSQDTFFDYDLKPIQFNYFWKSLSGTTIYAAILKKITYPNSVTYYDAEKTQNPRNLGNDGLTEAYHISSRYDRNKIYTTEPGESEDLNKITFEYSGDFTGYPTHGSYEALPDTYEFGSTQKIVETQQTVQNKYNGKKQLLSSETTVSIGNNIERSKTTYQEYHGEFKYKPNKIVYEEFVNENITPVRKLSTFFTYNSIGLLEKQTQPLTENQAGNPDLKKKYTVSYTYHSSFPALILSREWYQNEKDIATTKESTEYYSGPGVNGRPKNYVNALGEETRFTYELTTDNKVKKMSVEKDIEDGKESKVDVIYGPEYQYAYVTEQTGYTDKSVKSKYNYKLLTGAVSDLTEVKDDFSEIKYHYEYDDLGRLEKVINPSYSNHEGITYTSEQKYEYKDLVRSTEFFDANNKELTAFKVTKYQTVKDNNGNENEFQRMEQFYDGMGNLVLELFYDNQKAKWIQTQQSHYDKLGRKIYQVDSLNNQVTTKFDNRNRPYEVQDALGIVSKIDYDFSNRKNFFYLVGENNSKINKRETFYDESGRVSHTLSYPEPDKVAKTSYIYDIIGNVVKMIDPNTNEKIETIDPNAKGVDYEYDKLNRLNKVITPKTITEYGYSKLGNINLIKQYVGNEVFTRTKQYDELGHLDASIDESLMSRNYINNALGLPEQITDPNSNIFTIQYDDRKNIISYGGITADNKTYLKKNHFDQNPYGPLKTQLFEDNVLQSQYDLGYSGTGMINLKKIMAGNFQATVNFSYDDLNRIETVTHPDDFYTTYHYNKTRVEKVQVNGNNIANLDQSNNVVYEYNDYNGTLESITYPPLQDGTLIKTIYEEYDDNNRIKVLTNYKGSEILSRYKYEYDLNGNIRFIENNNKGWTEYVYDELNRLTDIYRPDGSKRSYTYNEKGDRLTLSDTNVINSLSTVSYNYNIWNELTSVDTDNIQTSFKYDSNGLRYSKTSSTGTKYYTYNNNNKVISVSDQNNGVISQFIWGPDRLLVNHDTTSDNQYYYLYNGHGDVTQIINTETKEVENEYIYDEWGNVTPIKEGIENEFKYAGELYDSETGLYYLRARYYDPSVGRFINKDSYEGDITNPLSLNLYTYVKNNPLRYVDPSGHREIEGAYADYDPIIRNITVGSSCGDGCTYVDVTQLNDFELANIATTSNSPEARQAAVTELQKRIVVPLDNSFSAVARGGRTLLSKIANILSKADRLDDAKNVLPIPEWVVNSFKGGNFEVEVLENDITVYRAWGGSSGETGSYFGAVKPSTAADADKLYYLSPYGNTMEKVSTFVIPKGTTVLKGSVEGGSGYQYYIEGAWNIVKKVGEYEILN